MRIACEKCNAVYSIAEKIIGPTGRMVKCAKCFYSWKVYPAAASTIPQIIPNSDSSKYLKIAAALLATIILVILFIFFSKDLIKHKPLKAIYEKFSIHDTNDIKLENFKFKTEYTDIVIDGILLNDSLEDKKTPSIRYTLLDKNKKIISSFTSTPSQTTLKSGEKLYIHHKFNDIRKPIKYLQIDIGNKLELLLTTQN